ncbi:MAG: integral membrane protein-like protein [uncultured bacterium]|nr:MAG: integral membrane protein-like protein [uncultured bacterium]
MYLLLLFLGFVVRVLLIPISGFKADMAFWKGWGLAVTDKGIIWLINNTNYNYPPGFAYVLSLIGRVYKLFADPYNISQYWMDNNLLYLFLFKIIIILSDVGIVFLIIKIAEKLKMKWGWLLAVLFFLNPAVLFDGVIWGQVDQFGLFLFLGAIYFFIENKPKLAAVIFTIAWLMKLQNIIFIPIFYLFVYRKYSFIDLIKSLSLSLITFAIITFPFWFYRETAGLVNLFTVNSNWFPWYSLNAFNGWWIASGLNGMGINDKTLVLGIINAKQFGLLLFSFFYFIASLNVFLAKKEDALKEFILSSALVVLSFFHLLTQSHERYLFHLIGFVIIFYFFKIEKKLSYVIGLLLAVTLGIFFNMYISMAYNYPDQIYWPFSAESTRSLTLFLSVFQIGIFIYFFIKYFSSFITKNYLLIIASLIVLFGVTFTMNLDYILRQPISLTKIIPVETRQDYLKPMIDMTVESARGVKYWNRLSNNYFFYDRGIGAHANSIITYGIGGRFSKFTTDFGIDTEAGEQNKAIFIIAGDGRELYKSKPKGKYDLPESISISIKGVNKLSLIIQKVGESNNGLHTDWLNPVLIR